MNLYNIPPDWLDRELVLTFFWNFSVFECALKRSKFLRKGRDDSAWPDWSGFGKSLEGKFDEVKTSGFKESVEVLKEASPRRQIVSPEGKLAWQEFEKSQNETEEQFVIRLLKTVRNNLFHGGKYPDGQIEEVARDKEILRSALCVLTGISELNPALNKHIRLAS